MEQNGLTLPDVLHPQAIIGIRFFNQRLYFEAHEALEAAWKEETGPIRDLYRGILQVAVAYYHIQHDNYIGARKMLLRCRSWLAPFPNNCLGIDLDEFTRDYLTVEQTLIKLGREKTHLLDPALLKPVPLKTLRIDG